MSTEEHQYEKGMIKSLIGRNKLETVIDALQVIGRQIPDKDLSNSIIILSGKYEKYARDVLLGLLTPEEQEVRLNQLNQSILDLIDDIPEDFFKPPPAPEPPSPPAEEDKIFKYFVIALFGMGILGIIVSFILVFVIDNAKWYELLIPPMMSLACMFGGGFFYLRFKNK